MIKTLIRDHGITDSAFVYKNNYNNFCVTIFSFILIKNIKKFQKQKKKELFLKRTKKKKTRKNI